MSRDDGDATAPTWNEFHEILSGNEAPKPRTVIGYVPLFPQSPKSPTDLAVVQASLDYFMLLTRKLGQDTTVVTADQAIYDIVKGKYILLFTTKKRFSVMLLLILLDFINVTFCTLLIVYIICKLGLKILIVLCCVVLYCIVLYCARLGPNSQ